ncbi:septum formation family protein [Luteipulveratus mongoliensis]|uniref:Septum formation-related domain-containing protein n=1 Tax=Luteipulveratus mongoliensis TaxID=571913 RepID=A0A0K1JL57_9MICO|nr:septum formation family protein [Luteipulveratus mongoliensis]AKU17457.1 hypothetical protein VV02_19090 [Luteipulveratus mongoliensis]
MRRPTRAVAVGAALVTSLLVAGCQDAEVKGGSTVAPSTAATSSSPATSDASQPPATSATSTAAATAYTAGTCMTKEPDWTVISCGGDHQYEVTAAVPTTQFADDMIKRHELREATCDRKAAEYVGYDGFNSTRYRSLTFPIAKDSAAGSRIVCLVGEFDESWDKVATVKGSYKGKLKGNAPYETRGCVEKRVTGLTSVEMSPCSKKHASEAVGGGFLGQPTDAYPGDAERNKRSDALCKPLFQAFIGKTTKPRTDIVLGKTQPSATGWSRGVRTSSCWAEVTSGQVTKTLKGIGDKPLTAYR